METWFSLEPQAKSNGSFREHKLNATAVGAIADWCSPVADKTLDFTNQAAT